MKTKLEQAEMVYDYLELFSEGYEEGNFDSVFSCLAEECIFRSQLILASECGSKAVEAYLKKTGEKLKESGAFVDCYIQEFFGKIKDEKQHSSIELNYLSGDLCLLIEQSAEDETNDFILKIELNEDEKISSIYLDKAEFFRYRSFRPFISLYPCIGDEEEIYEGSIRVSGHCNRELYLFFNMAGEEFDKYEDEHIPICKWVEMLECWKRFYLFETFDEAFEYACGIDYKSFTAKNESVRHYLGYNGSSIWNDRNDNSALLNGLIEWTDKYKDRCDYINSYGI